MANQPDSYSCDSTCSPCTLDELNPEQSTCSPCTLVELNLEKKNSINKKGRSYNKRREETGFLKYSLIGNRRAEGHFGKVNRCEKRGERYWEFAVMYRPFTAFPDPTRHMINPRKPQKTWKQQLVASPKDSFLTTIRDAQWAVILVGNRQKLQRVWHCTSYQTILWPVPVRQEIRI